MYDDQGYTIRGTYDFAVRSLELVEGYLGLNIKVHGDDEDLLNKGQIFLFNHFARFETLIPPYILHRQTKAYCRSVADHSLFTASKALGKFLSDVGAVPNNLPGLLPFLAAEILRGRKVVIFPEGAMIKDRRVLDEKGQLGVFSHKHNTFRKHHSGAAVLALTLDLFKHRIKDLFESNDVERIYHWVDSLGLSSPEHLLEQALKPTLIVPATITFFPIRVTDNFLSRGAEFFSRDKKLPAQLLEELAVEGNIIFRDTDMDIRLSKAIEPQRKWRWWDTLLMRKYFVKINALDDLFSLREVADTWEETLLVRAINRESSRIRDAYMEAIYSGITVNLGHLTASLICQMMDQGEKAVSFSVLHNALYFALKALQNTPGVHLHRSLLWPDRYRELADGISEDLSRFLNTCIQVELLEKTETGYKFLDKLYAEHEFHEVRLENPLMVCANEVAPVKAVGKAVKLAWHKAVKAINPRDLGNLLFDDELRAHAWNKSHHIKKRFQEINDRETATRNGSPYLLIHRKADQTGVLLIHGFLASPAELEDFGQKVYAGGYAVMGVRLSGHGTSPWDLHERRWEEWLNAVRRSYRILSLYVNDIVVVGFSAGAALALLLAAEKPEKLAGVASVAAPYTLQDKNAVFAPLMHGMNRLVNRFSGTGGMLPFRDNDPSYPDINYRSMPISALTELLGMIAAMKKALPEVETPVTIIQGTEDAVVKAESAKLLLEALKSCQHKELHWIPDGPHGLITGDVGETHALLLTFIKDMESTIKHHQEPRLEQETTSA
ncbi:MAG: alpha/beta fold hydrolase [Pseudomonadales bacterium]|nr:alpha/beta fold hydrolase [Pseudomonadales bacterium]